MRRFPTLPAALAVLAALALAAAGCGKSGALLPNVPPETVVFVTGPVDTVGSLVRLRWFGSDPDGEVVAYELKWIYAPGAQPAGYDSSVWTRTTRTDSTFSVYTPAGYSMPTFVVRAIDDQGEPDPTPARQDFQFRNDPPAVRLTGTPVLPATTLPVATITWNSSDPDGRISRASYLVWLDSDLAAAAVVPAGNSYTLPPSLFDDGAGGWRTGAHTVHIVCVDEGGQPSPPDSFTWNVVAPTGEVLLVDDVPAALSAAVDPMYTEAFDRQLGTGNYTRVNIEAANPFRSAADIRYSFGFFRSVFWYQENNTAFSPNLALAESGIRSLLGGGGNFYVSSVRLTGTGGAIPNGAFLHEIVGADSVRVDSVSATTNFSIGNARVLQPGPAVPYDSLRSVSISTGVEVFGLADPNDAAFLARPGVLDPPLAETVPVGVDRVPSGGAGRFVYLAFPLRFLGGTPSGAPSPAPDSNYGVRTVRRILARFGHGAAP